MESDQRRVISLLVDNQSGVLARVSNLFCRRGFNIDSLTVSATNDPSVSRITVIFNNSVLGMVRQWQTSFYGKRYSQTDPHRKTDFVKLADGFGLKGYRCTNLPEFQEAFADALQQKGPTWIECIIDKDEKVLPMIPGGGDINDIIME